MKRKKLFGFVATFLIVLAAYAGLPVSAAFDYDVPDVNGSNITRGGYIAPAYQQGDVEEFDFSNNVSAIFEKFSSHGSIQWRIVGQPYATNGGSSGGGGGDCPAPHMMN